MDVWFGAAAYGDRDYGEGYSRLFARVYDHEPDEDEIRRDAFVEANPDWDERYPGYTLHAASHEWEGTLTDALTIAIIPALPVSGQQVGNAGAAAAVRCDGSVRSL